MDARTIGVVPERDALLVYCIGSRGCPECRTIGVVPERHALLVHWQRLNKREIKYCSSAAVAAAG